MAMSDMTRPDGDDAYEPFDGEAEDDAPFAEEDARDNVDELAETGELEFGDEDDRLPWLEGDEDEDEYEGYKTGQLVAFVLLGLVLLGLIVGGIWWSTHRQADDELVADGSVIEAPDEPYKEKPESPGGKTFQGTGDTSFAVSEGEARPAQLGVATDTPKPGFESMDAASTSGSPAVATPGQGSTDAGDVSGVGAQIGAYSTRSSAEGAWSRLQQQYSALQGLRHRVVEGEADIGTVYRLQALPGDESAAHALCSGLTASGLPCLVKK